MLLLSFNLTSSELITAVAIGAIAGFLAKIVTNSKGGFIVSVIVGIIGSFVGRFVFEQFEIENTTMLLKIASSFVGACLFSWVANSFSN